MQVTHIHTQAHTHRDTGLAAAEVQGVKHWAWCLYGFLSLRLTKMRP